MIDIHIGREYFPGDVAMTLRPNDAAWLVEVLSVRRGGYEARLTPMTKDPQSGLYKMDVREPTPKMMLDDSRFHPLEGTYSFVRARNMIRLRLDNADFASVGR